MTFWDFAIQSPIVALLIVFIAGQAVREIVAESLRRLVTWRHGWPPVPTEASIDVNAVADGLLARLEERRLRSRR